MNLAPMTARLPAGSDELPDSLTRKRHSWCRRVGARQAARGLREASWAYDPDAARARPSDAVATSAFHAREALGADRVAVVRLGA